MATATVPPGGSDRHIDPFHVSVARSCGWSVATSTRLSVDVGVDPAEGMHCGERPLYVGHGSGLPAWAKQEVGRPAPANRPNRSRTATPASALTGQQAAHVLPVGLLHGSCSSLQARAQELIERVRAVHGAAVLGSSPAALCQGAFQQGAGMVHMPFGGAFADLQELGDPACG